MEVERKFIMGEHASKNSTEGDALFFEIAGGNRKEG